MRSVFLGPIVITFNRLHCLKNQIFFIFFRTALESDEEWSSEEEDDEGCGCYHCTLKNELMKE
jgi:hypothetical protein